MQVTVSGIFRLAFYCVLLALLFASPADESLPQKVKAVLMVSDEASLMAALERFNPDLVIADLSLLIRGEANVARLLKKRHPGTRVIILSVHDEPTAVEEATAAGVEGFVLKQRAAINLLRLVPANNVPAVSELCRRQRWH